MKSAQLVLATSLIFLATAGAKPAFAASQGAEVRVAKPSDEAYERDVDQVALASQEQAISKLSTLLRKYAGKRQEPVLLAKLAELQVQQAAILFRIAHGSAHRTKKAIDLSRYNKSLKTAISTVNLLLGKYPYYEEAFVAYFMRGKAYEELGDKKAATKDYLHLVKNFPDVEEALPAYMSLAEFAIEDNDHQRAIGYLKEVEKHPESPHYPFALYKLAWSYYNLKNIPTCLGYAERHIAYYNDKSAKAVEAGGSADTSEVALRDNTLSDVTVFYMEGLEQKIPAYQLTEALPYFKKLESGPGLGKMISKFAKLLRSHGQEIALIDWKNEILRKESDRPESLDVVITTYEIQLNRRRYEQITETAQDMVKLYQKHKDYEAFNRAQKLLLDTAEGLQTLIVKNKNATEVSSYSPTLASIYEAFTKIVDESDARIPRVHYNLAETLFTIKDYTGATQHYRWVVEHGKWGKVDPKHKEEVGTMEDASLKAIASRYEVLRQRQIIPKELAAKSIADDSDKSLDPLLAEWIDWLDTHVKHSTQDTENFIFEANRTLYSQRHIKDAIDRLKPFARKNPKSTYAIPSASLVIDTFIASADWEKTHELASDFLEVSDWKDTPFAKHLVVVASDAYYKQIEGYHRAKEFKTVLKRSDEFLKKYPQSARLADCLTLAGSAAIQMGEKKRATEYFSRLIKEVPKADSVGTALLARAGISEERYQFAAAASDYKFYLGLPTSLIKLKDSELLVLRRKTLALTWLSGDAGTLKSALDTKAICTEALATDCEKYHILALLADPVKAGDEKTTEEAFDRARNGEKDNRTLWAILALEGAKNLAWRDRLHMARQIGTGWDDLDPLVRFVSIPHVTASLPKVFQMDRKMMREIAPLRANEKYITHRIDVVREIEAAATKSMKVPWSRVRAEVLNEVAGLYLDIARELQGVSPPKGLSPEDLTAYNDTVRKLVMPFEEKGQEIRSKAFEIASRFSVDDESFAAISEPFFAENPSQAKVLKPAAKVEMGAPLKLDLTMLDELDSHGKWDNVDAGKYTDSDDNALYLKAMWAQALKARRWQQVGFYIQEASEKKLIEKAPLGLVRAVSLAAVGARGEALGELSEVRKSLDPNAGNKVLITLLQYSLKTCGRDRTKELLKEIEVEELSKKEVAFVVGAGGYAGVEMARAPASEKAPTSDAQKPRKK